MSGCETPSLAAIGAAIEEGRLSPEGLCERALARITETQPALGAFIRPTPERAREAATAAARRARSGRRLGPLDGVPVAVKGNLALSGVVTDAASRILEGYRPPFDATAVRRLEAAGAVVVGQTNLDELGMGAACAYSAHGPTANPWDPSRTPGGSSGGSAAAVAAGVVPLSLGTDTGGSVRLPAALCGLAGLRPTYGRISRYGLFAFASSMDQVGPMAPRVEDLIPAFLALSGPDPRDATSVARPLFPPEACLDADLSSLRVGIPAFARDLCEEAAVWETLEEARGILEAGGAVVEEVDLELGPLGVAAYHVIAAAEASSNLARYDGVRYGRRAAGARDLDALYRRTRSEGFGAEVRRRVLLGTLVLCTDTVEETYLAAERVRRVIAAEIDGVFARQALLLLPAAPRRAWPKEAMLDDPVSLYRMDAFTVPASLAGLPALTVPMGLAGGLPLAVQLVAPAFEEARLFAAGVALERARGPARLAPCAAPLYWEVAA